MKRTDKTINNVLAEVLMKQKGDVLIVSKEEIEHMLEEEKKILEAKDGCKGCAFEAAEQWEMPCCKCKRNCRDFWRAKR